MSNKVPKSKAKAIKKENAIKKARIKTLIIVLIVVLIVVAAAFLGIYVRGRNSSTASQNSAEIYSLGRDTVQLFKDGTFSASLPHSVQKSGTYTKTTDGSRIIVSFNVDGMTNIGRIENNALYLPHEWDDGHGHSHDNVFPRVSGAR